MVPQLQLGSDFTLADLNERNRNTMAEHIGVEYIEVNENYLKARMPVDHRTHQPLGMLNGGASLALAEITGSMAANLCLDRTQFVALGLDLNANHVKGVKEGWVYATAKPYHVGRTTQVWEIRIEDEEQNLVCVARLTMVVVPVNKS
jgi:1,4-dihydroxy-2-naphthoyl-CoA hydrolase